MLAVWYMTSPMVMWMHISIPKKFVSDPAQIQRFIKLNASNVELAITTMGPLGKARITKLPLKNLHREKRRLGLVNFVRDATRENAKRPWYQFRAVSQFKIEDGLLYNKKAKEKWMWYKIQEASKPKSSKSVNTRSQGKPQPAVQKSDNEGAGTQHRKTHSFDALIQGSSCSHSKLIRELADAKPQRKRHPAFQRFIDQRAADDSQHQDS